MFLTPVLVQYQTVQEKQTLIFTLNKLCSNLLGKLKNNSDFSSLGEEHFYFSVYLIYVWFILVPFKSHILNTKRKGKYLLKNKRLKTNNILYYSLCTLIFLINCFGFHVNNWYFWKYLFFQRKIFHHSLSSSELDILALL